MQINTKPSLVPKPMSNMRYIVVFVLTLFSLTGFSVAQPFKDFAADMTMKNLHNELEQRRQEQSKTQGSKFNATVKNYTSLLVLSWVIANQKESLPPNTVLDAMMQSAEESLDAAGVFDSRNLEIDVMTFTSREFKSLQEKWLTVRGDPVAEKRLSDETWLYYKERGNIDLRAASLSDFHKGQ